MPIPKRSGLAHESSAHTLRLRRVSSAMGDDAARTSSGPGRRVSVKLVHSPPRRPSPSVLSSRSSSPSSSSPSPSASASPLHSSRSSAASDSSTSSTAKRHSASADEPSTPRIPRVLVHTGRAALPLPAPSPSTLNANRATTFAPTPPTPATPSRDPSSPPPSWTSSYVQPNQPCRAHRPGVRPAHTRPPLRPPSVAARRLSADPPCSRRTEGAQTPVTPGCR